jgi:hypothetical protein
MPLRLVLGNYGALSLIADLPVINRLEERTLEKAQCFIHGSARALFYARFWAAAVDSRDAKILSLLIKDRVFTPICVARTVVALARVQYLLQRRRVDPA